MSDGNDATSGKNDDVPYGRFKAVNEEKKASDAENVTLKAEIVELRKGNNSIGIAANTPQQEQVAQEKQNQTKVYTRQELNKAVADGVISEDGANTLWDEQNQKALNKTVQDTVQSTIASTAQDNDTNALIDRYMAARPDVAIKGTEDRKAVNKKFDDLAKRGYERAAAKGGRKTELLALEMALGPIDALEAAAKGVPKNDTHQETGGSGGGDGSENDASDMPKGMTDRQKMHYSSQIDKGIISDWKAVAEELNFQNKDLTARSKNL